MRLPAPPVAAAALRPETPQPVALSLALALPRSAPRVREAPAPAPLVASTAAIVAALPAPPHVYRAHRCAIPARRLLRAA